MLTTLKTPRPLLGATAVMTAVLLLAACGDKGKAPTQAAARVNDKGEITVHQINQVLQQQPGLQPAQVDAASRQVLEKLIDQQLAIEQAEDKKIDRQPNVVAAIEAARREIIARAFAEQIASAVAKPSADEVAQYFQATPALFANRRIYDLLEMNIEAPGERAPDIAEHAKAAKSAAELSAWLDSQQLRATSRRVTQPAENLPLDLLDRLATMNPGQVMVAPVPGGVKLIVVEQARNAPVDLDKARPAIEQFLLNDRKLKAVQAEQKRLRAAAKIEYLGKFAEAASAPAATPAGAEPASSASPTPPAAVPAPASAAQPPAGGLAPDAVKKGLGLK